MKNFLNYYLKRRLLAVIIVGIGFLITTSILLYNAEFISYKPIGDGTNNIKEIPGSTNMFIYLTVMISSLCIVVPILEFAFKMKRRSIDLYYSLPIKRIKLYLLKYLLGLGEILVIFLPNWIVSYIWTSSVATLYSVHFYWYYLVIAIAFGIGIYTYLTFFFTMANSLIDGIIFMVMGACFLAFTMNVICAICIKNGVVNNIFYMRNYFIFSPLFNFSQELYYIMCGDLEGAAIYRNILALVLIILLCLGAGVGFFLYHARKNSAELVSDDSNFILGYRTMLPILIITGFRLLKSIPVAVSASASVESISALWVVVALLGYFGYCIFRRSFRIKKEDILALSLSIVTGVLIAIFI